MSSASQGSGAIMEALKLACSQNPEELKVGEKKLKDWEKEKGFNSELAGVFSNRCVETQVRWMALTCAKNGVDQYWRVGAMNAIDEDEKVVIRAALLQCIEDPVPQVSTQLSVLIARIARLDCPEMWPELLPVLTEGIQSSKEATRKCHLTTMKHVIKTLASRRLIPQRKVFNNITTGLFVSVVRLWNAHLQEGVAQLSGGEEGGAVSKLEMGWVCLKILRHMILHGFPKFNAILEALQFMGTLLERVPELVELRSRLPKEHPARPTLKDTINLTMKIVSGVQSHQPIGFASFVTPSLELVYRLIFSAEYAGKLFESVIISCLNLFRLILVCEDYNPPRAGIMTESVPPPGIMEAHQAKLAFFKASTCQHLLERLVGHYLLLTEEELQLWVDNPEDFSREQPGNTPTCSLRECVESALVALVHGFQLTISPNLLAMVQTVQTMDANADSNSLRVKDAVYKAAGLCAFELYDDLDYDSWYQAQLLKELEVHDPRYQIVRHRVVWLLGQWVTVKMSSSLRPSLYQVLVPILSPNENLAVRLAAAEVIRVCVDDLDFSVEEFEPVLSNCTSYLFRLLHDAKAAETKMRVLNVVSLLMERVGPGIRPHVPALLQALPTLWEDSLQQNCDMLRTIIIVTLIHITNGLGVASEDLHSFILPVVHIATADSQHVHYLAEDGLLLWLAVLHHSSSPSPALMQLLGNMIGILGLQPPSDESSASMAGLMDIASTCFETCIEILDAYTVLCSVKPEYYIEFCSEVVLRTCQYYLCDVKPEGVTYLVNLLARVVKLYPTHSPGVLEPLLPVILRKLLGEEDYPPTTCVYLTLVARVLVHQPNYFFTLLERICSQSQQTAAELFGLIVDTWSVRLDSVANIQCRKLTGLAIANLLPVADVCVISRFDTLVNMCVEVMHDVMDTSDEDNQLYDLLVSGEGTSPEAGTTPVTQHSLRENKLSQFDPLHTISLHHHLVAKFEQCLSVHGPATYSNLISKVSLVVREQLLEFVPLKAAGQLLNIFLQDDMTTASIQ